MTIRKYHDSDCERLKEITVQQFDGVSIDQNIDRLVGDTGTTWQFRKTRHIDVDVETNPEGVFVAEETGKVIGYITTRIDYDTGIGWIPNMAVAADYAGKGVGKQLMSAALDYMRLSGMKFVRIETLEQNEIGARWYPRLGFKEVAKQIHYCMKL